MWLTILGASLVAILAYIVSEYAYVLDQQLNACGTGTYKDRKCQCIHPYTGTHCEIIDCGFGELVDSVWDVDSITTPLDDIASGCKCESQYWGYNCLNCTSMFLEGCTGACERDYYGARCDTLCREGSEFDAEGVNIELSGGVYNYFAKGRGMCMRDGSVRCNEGTAGRDCSIDCKNCKHGNCNRDTGDCDCFAGFAGELCDVECPGRCSGNSGVCRFNGETPFCECVIKFTGADCSLPCCARGNRTRLGVTNGECAEGVGGCICDPGWQGDECDCHRDKTCNGRGDCNADGSCECDRNFAGRNCEMCADDRIGPFCQYDKYTCPDKPGHGELVAINAHGDYACKCDAGFEGKTCNVCADSVYPKSGPNMCEYVVPASMCNNGKVRDDYAGTGVMCECTGQFSAASNCAGCKLHYYGAKCDVLCDSRCGESGGTCVHTPEPGCLCPKGMRAVNGKCQVCGGDGGCLHGECYGGRCQCDPGWYGDSCAVAAPQYRGKTCNGDNGVAVVYKEKASCSLALDCTDTLNGPIENRQVALRAEKYKRTMFCYRSDVPASLRTVTGCCVDENADGKCDAAHLLKSEQECEALFGETVDDICDARVLEGEVNVFEWCLSKQLNCTKNGACADPDFCVNRCDAGLKPYEWRLRWEIDHVKNMNALMSEPWRFTLPSTFSDPYLYREAYATASLTDVCAAGGQYDRCLSHLIPDDASVFNVTSKFVNGSFEPMPSYQRCKFTKHIRKNVDGNLTVRFPRIYVDRMRMMSDEATTIAYGRDGSSNEAYYGVVQAEIDSVTLYGRGVVEVVMYEHTDDACETFLLKSGGDFTACQQLQFFELDYKWGSFCEWYRNKNVSSSVGGFDQRCYDQSRICVGCEDYQENCEGLPLGSSPMPAPCANNWEGFCDVYLDTNMNVDGRCAFAECECTGYGIGGRSCGLSCPVPQFTGSDRPCGEGEDPPWGLCVEANGAIAFGYEQGRCECFNGGNPTEGCALTCTEEQDCSPDIDTRVTIESEDCDFAHVDRFEGSGWASFNGTKQYFTEVIGYNASCGQAEDAADGVCLKGPVCESEEITYAGDKFMCVEDLHVHMYGDEPTASRSVSPDKHCENGVVPSSNLSCASACVGNELYSIGVNASVPCICFNSSCATVPGGEMYRYYATPPNPGTTGEEKAVACFEACRDKVDNGDWQDDGIEISGFIVDRDSGQCGCKAAETSVSFCSTQTVDSTVAPQVTIDYGFADSVLACPGTEVTVNWQGVHNIQETLTAKCSSSNVGAPFDLNSPGTNEFLPSGSSITFSNDELVAQPGSRRFFKCSSHCGETSARFEVYCPAQSGTGQSYELATRGHYCARDVNINHPTIFITSHNYGKGPMRGDEPLYPLLGDPDPKMECMKRCLYLYPTYRGFYTDSSYGCFCSRSCEPDKRSHYTSTVWRGYRIVVNRPMFSSYVMKAPNCKPRLPHLDIVETSGAIQTVMQSFYGQLLDPITCHIFLPDSMCNYWRGKCECAQPFTTMRRNNVPVYLNPAKSYRIALMQGYDIEQYVPFMDYRAPLQSIVTLVAPDRFCGDEQAVFASYTCSECEGQYFFKRDDNECVCSTQNSLCSVEKIGWDQYKRRDLTYRYEGRGICDVNLVIDLKSSSASNVEIRLGECASACDMPQYDGFGITKDDCVCTSFACDDRITEMEAFLYTARSEESVDDLIGVFDNGSPKLRCYKDIEHTQEVPCDWIRALKHFARGSSYRAGDCSFMAPGADEISQIPCSGHGFSSSGTCACDYAENFDIRGSGVGLTFEAPTLRQTPFRGKSCQLLCPGYDMKNMESVCSGHGLCTTDGRCDCMQGFTGESCSLACEVDQGPLTCSGHGTCDERRQVHRTDIVTTLKSMACTEEKLYLSRDRVVESGSVLYYMKKERGGLQTYIFNETSSTYEKRDTVIADFYIRGNARRRPYGTSFVTSVSSFDGTSMRVPFMPCSDTIRIRRETYTNTLFPQNKSDVSIDCDLKYGDDPSGYTIFCGMCTCEENSRTGNWTGFDCRTPSLGFYGEDARRQCPGMTSDGAPCNGGGTCSWGSILGEGDQIYGSSQCFCGDVTHTSTLATAPRNHDNEILYHVSSDDVPLYVDSHAYFTLEDGNMTVSDRKCWDPVEYSGATSKESCRNYCLKNYPSSCIVMDGTTCSCCASECSLEYPSEFLIATSGKCSDLSTTSTVVSYVQSGRECQDASEHFGAQYRVYLTYDDGDVNDHITKAPCIHKEIFDSVFVMSNQWHGENIDTTQYVSCTSGSGCVCKKVGVAASGATYDIGCEDGLRLPTETECVNLGGTYGATCVRDGSVVCVPDKNLLSNYNLQDCSCRYGWSGKRCDKERMMCLFSGEENSEGDKCTCTTPDGTLNPRTQESGCCTVGTYFHQSQYSGFTPLLDFKVLSNNLFYTEALLQVCQPAPTALAFENDNKRILGIHNYVASTDEYVLMNVSDCANEYKESIYYAVERYYSTSDTVATLTFEEDDVTDRVQACLHHCVKTNVDEESGGTSVKGFTLTGFSSHTITSLSGRRCSTQDFNRVRPFSGPTGPNRNPGITPEQRVQYCEEACTGGSRLVDSEPRGHNDRFWNYFKPSDVTHFLVGTSSNNLGRCYCETEAAPDADNKCEDGRDAIDFSSRYESYRIVKAKPQCACESEPAYFSAISPSSNSKRFDIVYPYSEDGDCFVDSTGKIVRHIDQHGAFTFAKQTGIPKPVTIIKKKIQTESEQTGDFSQLECYEKCLQSDAYTHDNTTCACVTLQNGADAVETTYSLAPTRDPGIIKTLSNHYVITKDIAATDETTATEACFDKCKRCPSFGVGNRTTDSGLEWDCYCLETDLIYQAPRDPRDTVGIDTVSVKQWAVGCAGVANDPDTEWKTFDRRQNAGYVVHRLKQQVESLTALYNRYEQERDDMLYRCARTPQRDRLSKVEYGEYDYFPNGWCRCECTNPDNDVLNINDTPVYSPECEKCFIKHGCTAGGWAFYDNIYRSDAFKNQNWYGREDEKFSWGNHRNPYNNFCDGKVWGDNIDADWFQDQYTRMLRLQQKNASVLVELESAQKTYEYENAIYEQFQNFLGDGYCLPDSNKHTGKSLLECIALCDADSTCNAFSHNEDGSECILASNGCNDSGEFAVNNFPWKRFKKATASSRRLVGGLEDLIGGYGGPTTDPTCVSPTGTPAAIGYIIQHVFSDYRISTFSVNVQCAQNYVGHAKATVCSGDGQPFTLSGCTMQVNSANNGYYDGTLQMQWRPGKTYLTTPTVFEYSVDSFLDTMIKVVPGTELVENPYVCNIESYLNYGNIPGETCNCPIWSYDKLYEVKDYVKFGQGFCLPDTRKETGKTLEQCESTCTDDPECVAFSFYNGECIFSSNGCDEDGEWNTNQYAWERYAWAATEASKNRCCLTGETVAYSEPFDDVRSNLHSCIQECTQKKKATSRVSYTDKFNCHCGDKVYTESECPVFKSNCDESQYALRLEPDSPSEMCKCSGSYVMNGNVISCPSGKYMPEDSACATSCKTCPFGKFSEKGDVKCRECGAGQIRDSNAGCSTCAAGKYSTSGDKFCTDCVPGKFSFQGSGSCTLCPKGYFASNSGSSTCTRCSEGSVSKIGATTCTECAAGTYSGGFGSDKCTQCAKGKYSSQSRQASESACKSCPDGWIAYQPGMTWCAYCQKGTFMSSDRAYCYFCHAGKYQNENAKTSCKLCNAGQYQNAQGKSSCKRCPRGFARAQTGSSSCSGCNVGMYQDSEGGTKCKGCGSTESGFSWVTKPTPRTSFEVACDMIKSCSYPYQNLPWCRTDWFTSTSSGGDHKRRCCYTYKSDSCDGLAIDDGDVGAFHYGNTPDYRYKACIPDNKEHSCKSMALPVSRFGCVILDLEFVGDITTSCSDCYIWNIGAVKPDGSEFSVVINVPTNKKTHPGCVEITEKFLKKNNAVDFEVGFKMFCNWMGSQAVVITHNCFKSDKIVLEAECKRRNIEMPCWYFYDSLLFLRSKLQLSSYRLSDVYKAVVGEEIRNEHVAIHDARALWEILKRIPPDSLYMYPKYLTPLQNIKFVGSSCEQRFVQLGVRSVEDLLLRYKQYIQTTGDTRTLVKQFLAQFKLPTHDLGSIANEIVSNWLGTTFGGDVLH